MRINQFSDISSCVAISGLGSHAFGSWKDRDSHFMWLRDALPDHLQGARVLIYGYDSKLAESRSYQNLEDVASKFRQSLSVVLGERISSRPLIFVAHSLGGLVLKQAMIEMASEDASAAEFENFKATFAILFFGVPNQGMDIRSLHAMVRGQPNEPFTSYFDRDAGFLHQLINKFRETFHFRDSHIISFFETKASPTAKLDSTGRWSMSGEPAVLVDRHSAKSGRSWEDQRSHLYPINCTHSDMVKFCEHDDDLDVILERLTRFVYMAPAVIKYRWENHAEVSSPPNRNLVSGRLLSSPPIVLPANHLLIGFAAWASLTDEIFGPCLLARSMDFVMASSNRRTGGREGTAESSGPSLLPQKVSPAFHVRAFQGNHKEKAGPFSPWNS